MKQVLKASNKSRMTAGMLGDHSRVNIFWSLAVIGLAGIILWPLLRPGFWISDDGEWMVIRLSAFYQSLRDGQIPVRILGRLNDHYGYPVANFLYPGFLYLGSLIKATGVSFVTSIKLLFAGLIISGGLATFWTLKKFFGAAASFVGALTYLFAPYLVFDLYTRGSVGEIMAMAVATWSIFCVVYGWRRVLPFTIAMLLVSHNSLALLLGGYLFIWMLLSGQLKTFIAPLLIGIGLSTFFWLPAVVEKQLVKFDNISVANSVSYLLGGNKIFLLGLGSIMSIFIFADSELRKKKMYLFHAAAVLTAGLLTLPIAEGLWIKGPLVIFFQFPYRFLAVSVISGSWLAAIIVDRFKSWWVMGIIAASSVAIMLPSLARVAPVIREDGYYTTNEGTTTVADEYMPKWVMEKSNNRAERPIVVFSGEGILEIGPSNTRKIVATIQTQEANTIQINSLYYPGWGILVDGVPIEINYQNPQGLMRFDVSAGTHVIVAEFRETVFRFIADCISVSMLIVYIVFIFIRRPVAGRRLKIGAVK